MRVLLDTRLLVWAADEPERLSREARELIDDRARTPVFSVASIWELAIKFALPKPLSSPPPDPRKLRRGLLANGYEELGMTGEHALAVARLPPLHGDPFDRLLVAQSIAEGIPFATADRRLAGYPGEVLVLD